MAGGWGGGGGGGGEGWREGGDGIRGREGAMKEQQSPHR